MSALFLEYRYSIDIYVVFYFVHDIECINQCSILSKYCITLGISQQYLWILDTVFNLTYSSSIRNLDRLGRTCWYPDLHSHLHTYVYKPTSNDGRLHHCCRRRSRRRPGNWTAQFNIFEIASCRFSLSYIRHFWRFCAVYCVVGSVVFFLCSSRNYDIMDQVCVCKLFLFSICTEWDAIDTLLNP